jgi:shikimate dehydrogenase
MTEHYALFGDPITRSPSPAMHNAGFRALGRDAHYELCPLPASAAAAVVGLVRERYAGANITIPLKTLVAHDVPLTGVAARARAVNTLFWQEGRLLGALTDVEGVRAPLGARSVTDVGTGLVLGAGGAARAAVLALLPMCERLIIAARRESQAHDMLAELEVDVSKARVIALNDPAALSTAFATVDLVVQATPQGGQGEALVLPWHVVARPLVAFELLAVPRQTPFCVSAAAVGATVIEGWEMLLVQGMRSFELWTGGAAPQAPMRAALLASLAHERA